MPNGWSYRSCPSGSGQIELYYDGLRAARLAWSEREGFEDVWDGQIFDLQGELRELVEYDSDAREIYDQGKFVEMACLYWWRRRWASSIPPRIGYAGPLPVVE